jgi:hypothetical protein
MRSGPDTSPGRRPPKPRPSPSQRGPAARVTDGPVNQAVAAKLWRLHWDHGYFTRAEIEAALGTGQSGADGQWTGYCGGEAA